MNRGYQIAVYLILLFVGISPTSAEVTQDFNSYTSWTTNDCYSSNGWELCIGRVITNDAFEGGSAVISAASNMSYYLRSPLLSNGYGTISFVYDREPGGNAMTDIYIQESSNGIDWTTIDVILNTHLYSSWNAYSNFLYQPYERFLRLVNSPVNPGQPDPVLIQEGFNGGSVTPPAGWVFSGLGQYTLVSSSGEEPPSIKFDSTGDEMITPEVSAPTNLSFWLKGQSAGPGNTFTIEGWNTNWVVINVMSNISSSSAVYSYPVSTNFNRFRFSYEKLEVGNIAFDDVLILGSGGNVPTTLTEVRIDSLVIGDASPVRIQNFDDWPRKGSYSSGVDAFHGWSVNDCIVDENNTYEGQVGRLNQNAGAYIVSHLYPDGVGYIAFKYRSWDSSPTAFANIEYTTNDVDWLLVTNIGTSATAYQQFLCLLNITNNVRVRIIKTSGERLLLDEIFLTEPVSGDLSFEYGTDPQIPGSNTSVTLVGNLLPGTNVLNSDDITAYYRIGTSGTFQAIGMRSVTTPELGLSLQSTNPVPAQPPGIIVQFYFTVASIGSGTSNIWLFPSGGSNTPAEYIVSPGSPYQILLTNYYFTAHGLSGAALQDELHLIIRNSLSLGHYSTLYQYYPDTDAREDGTVWDMYSDNPDGTNPYNYEFDSCWQCGIYMSDRVEGDCYFGHHTWPLSWFGSSEPMSSDLFHVYPADSVVVYMRNNHPFGEVSYPNEVSLNGSKQGPSSLPGYTNLVFEPIDEYKGDFARSYFYFSTRYKGQDAGWQENGAVVGAELKPWHAQLLLKWHEEDPVSTKEIDRNNAVYNIQSNRNPFIDVPAYANSIWGDFTNTSLPDIMSTSPGRYVATLPSTTTVANITGYVNSNAVGGIKWLNLPFGALGYETLTSSVFSLSNVLLFDGMNQITMVASNASGQTAGHTLTVYRQTDPLEDFNSTSDWVTTTPCNRYDSGPHCYEPVGPVNLGEVFCGYDALQTRGVVMGHGGYAWKLDEYASLEFSTRGVLTNFSVYLASHDNDPGISLTIMSSTNGGINYYSSTIWATNGTWFAEPKRFQRYESPVLNLSPETGGEVLVAFYNNGSPVYLDNFTFNPSPHDLDNDRLPDAWETNSFGSVEASDGSADTDGDTFTDRQEFLVHTHPNNSNSFFFIDNFSILSSDSAPSLVWPSASGLHYRVYGGTTPTSYPEVISGSRVATPPVNTYEIGASLTNEMMYYRISAE